ncbi:MAG TPA: hypothetical protein VN026_17450 [Bacteroidia bacterium]|jgi:hypothetical protein|nr:hypothetical protein [Bacteroidia bacterium]
MKNLNKIFSVSSEGMETGSLKFNFRSSHGTHGQRIESVNEIRYSVTVGKDRVWILLPPFLLLSFTADGFESGQIYFQHRVTTKDGTTEWGESGEVEITVYSYQLTTNSMDTVH